LLKIWKKIDVHCQCRLPQQVPILVLGNHFLEGKRVALKKPFAIIMKKDQPEHAPIDQEAEKHGTTCADYSMVGVIRYKYLFKNRPKPLQ